MCFRGPFRYEFVIKLDQVVPFQSVISFCPCFAFLGVQLTTSGQLKGKFGCISAVLLGEKEKDVERTFFHDSPSTDCIEKYSK